MESELQQAEFIAQKNRAQRCKQLFVITTLICIAAISTTIIAAVIPQDKYPEQAERRRQAIITAFSSHKLFSMNRIEMESQFGPPEVTSPTIGQDTAEEIWSYRNLSTATYEPWLNIAIARNQAIALWTSDLTGADSWLQYRSKRVPSANLYLVEGKTAH